MKLRFSPYKLKFKHPFGVSSNVRTHTPTVFLSLEIGGFKGYGEACIPAYLGETEEETIAFFNDASATLKKLNSDFNIAETVTVIDGLSETCNAAKAAIDIALHDLKGKILGKNIRQLYDLPVKENSVTSSTIGLDYADKIAQKIIEASDFKILKIKAGSENDKALINMIRSYTDKPLYVDVNQGWKDKHFVVDMLHFMAENNVLLVEQPMPVEMIDEMAWVTERSPVPTIADESVKRLKDISRIKGAFSGINIKLMKCTGISEALRMIDLARESNLKVMLGCMAESSCATTAMAHLAGLADYIDLDAPYLIVNDPFKGISYNNGQICLPHSAGIGLKLLNAEIFS